MQLNGNIEYYLLNELNIYLGQWKYLFEVNETLHWIAIKKIYRFQIKIYLEDISNEMVYLTQMKI